MRDDEDEDLLIEDDTPEREPAPQEKPAAEVVPMGVTETPVEAAYREELHRVRWALAYALEMLARPYPQVKGIANFLTKAKAQVDGAWDRVLKLRGQKEGSK